jgi:hypothetical protein
MIRVCVHKIRKTRLLTSVGRQVKRRDATDVGAYSLPLDMTVAGEAMKGAAEALFSDTSALAQRVCVFRLMPLLEVKCVCILNRGRAPIPTFRPSHASSTTTCVHRTISCSFFHKLQ